MTEEQQKELAQIFEAMGNAKGNFVIGQVMGTQINYFGERQAKDKKPKNGANDGNKGNQGIPEKLPEKLATSLAMKYWKKLQSMGFVDTSCYLMPGISRKQAMYIADIFSEKLGLRNKWKPFQDLWRLNNLAQEKYDMQEKGTIPLRHEDIEKAFED